LRQAVEAVGSYAQGLSCLAEPRQSGDRHPLLPARRKARATAVRGTVGFAEAFPDAAIVSALRRQLSWTHFKQLIYMAA
jgi:hypothetical protein